MAFPRPHRACPALRYRCTSQHELNFHCPCSLRKRAVAPVFGRPTPSPLPLLNCCYKKQEHRICPLIKPTHCIAFSQLLTAPTNCKAGCQSRDSTSKLCGQRTNPPALCCKYVKDNSANQRRLRHNHVPKLLTTFQMNTSIAQFLHKSSN